MTTFAGLLAAGCGNACSDARERIEECSGRLVYDYDDCSGAVECAAECVRDADCAAITGEDPAGTNEIAECASRCTSDDD